ncbi:hypothetical protein BH10ACT4_BH10ACT4_13680 [soil metagenome]
MIVNRLTVDGRDYFLPDPVTALKARILEAIQAGGGYVTIPPLKSGTGVEILFSPGMPVLWTQLDVGGDSAGEPLPEAKTARGEREFGEELESTL